jgi:hypothetical protein
MQKFKKNSYNFLKVQEKHQFSKKNYKFQKNVSFKKNKSPQKRPKNLIIVFLAKIFKQPQQQKP